jgi:hypothetical protein
MRFGAQFEPRGMCQTVSAASAPSLSRRDAAMDTMESDQAHTPIVVQIARVALVGVMITIAVWLVTSYALDLLGVSLFK